MDGRIPPQALDAERYVIGAMLIDREGLETVLAALQPEDFYSPHHRKLFVAMRALAAEDKPVDCVTLGEQLQKSGNFNTAEDVAYIAELSMNVTSAANCAYHCAIVKQRSDSRRLISVGLRLASDAYDETNDPYDAASKADDELFNVLHVKTGASITPLSQIVGPVIEDIEDIIGGKKQYTGIPCNLRFIDDYLGGFEPGCQYVIAGRPSQGKTALVLSIMNNIGSTHPIGFFSIEMSPKSIAKRLLSMRSGFTYRELNRGAIPREEFKRVTTAARVVAGLKINIHEKPITNPMELKSAVRLMVRKFKICGFVVDYLQLITTEGNNRNNEIAQYSRIMKGLAKEFDIFSIVLSQLSRKNESRPDKTPILSDLYESGAIEADADTVMFVHRPEYYGADTYDHPLYGQIPTENYAQIVVAKNRNDETGVVDATFNKKTAQFMDYCNERPSSMPHYVAGRRETDGPV